MPHTHVAFLIGCIGFRLSIALYAKHTTPEILRMLGFIALLPAIGFLFIYMNDLRKVGFEAGGKIWWNSARPIHGVLYLLFAMYAIKKQECAWLVLLLDTFLGFTFWYMKYYALKE